MTTGPTEKITVETIGALRDVVDEVISDAENSAVSAIQDDDLFTIDEFLRVVKDHYQASFAQ